MKKGGPHGSPFLRPFTKALTYAAKYGKMFHGDNKLQLYYD